MVASVVRCSECGFFHRSVEHVSVEFVPTAENYGQAQVGQTVAGWGKVTDVSPTAYFVEGDFGVVSNGVSCLVLGWVSKSQVHPKAFVEPLVKFGGAS
jgi:hypothetical protein